MSFHEGSNWQANKEDKGEPLYKPESKSPIPTKEWLEQKAKDPGTPNPPVLFEVWDKDNSQAPTKEGLEERAEKWLTDHPSRYENSLMNQAMDEGKLHGFIAGAQSSLQPVAKFSTHILEGVWGWQAGFTIEQQTFYLQPDDTEEKAKWYQKSLEYALNKLISPTPSPDPTVLVQALKRIEKICLRDWINEEKAQKYFRDALNIVEEALNKYNNKKEEGI